MNDGRALDSKVHGSQDNMESSLRRVKTSERKNSLSRDSKGQLVQVGEDHLTKKIVASNEVIVEHGEANTILFGRTDRDDELLIPDGVQRLLELRSLPNLGVPSICR